MHAQPVNWRRAVLSIYLFIWQWFAIFGGQIVESLTFQPRSEADPPYSDRVSI